ncbi:DUF3768 domain-containing protein [Sphingomonas sp. 179-I 2A4 NHS]|jgi:hypothetical protein|uniref:DUF3768 domain-containing protein n=1 Tax=unclassified Sphingomonas TaxID=196159 RepID=UPI003879B700
MRFARHTRHHDAYNVTPRKIAAFERKKVAERNALPLFAAQTAARQISADEEMQRREENWTRRVIERRGQIAAEWREVRARFYALPPHIRAEVRSRWARWTGPLTASMQNHIRREVAKTLTAEPDDFASMSVAERIAETARLNDIARAREFYWTHWDYSPGLLLWLSPFFEPTPEQPEPHRHLTVSRGLWSRFYHAFADYADWGHNTDPSGEHREGIFTIDAQAFRFEISYHRYDSDEESRVPWNTDLTRRVVWVGLADERRA